MPSSRRWFEFWKTNPRQMTIGEIADRVRGNGHAAIQLRDLRAQVARPNVSLDGSGFGGSGTPISGAKLGTEEYNRALQGKNAIATYDKMRRGDAQVRATLQMIALPLLSAVWEIQPPEKGDAQDQAVADFCAASLLDDDAMIETWDYTLRHILLQLPFGFSPLEKIWTVGEVNELRYMRLAPRLPFSIEEWQVDENGALIAMVQRASKGGNEQSLTIPADYLAVFVHEKEGDNYNGMSILRSAYKHWYYKDQFYTIDGIAHERWSAGTPVAKLQEGAIGKPSDLADVIKVLESFRAHELGYAIEPPYVDYRIMVPDGTRSNEGIMRSIEHHDVMIARNILAPFMNVGQAEHGTRSSTEELVDVFFNSIEGVAKGIASSSKRQLIKPLCDFNFNMQGRQYPTLVATNIRKTDPDRLSQTMERLLKAGGLTYDPGLENMLRSLLGFAPLDPSLVAVRENAPQAREDDAGAANGNGSDNPSGPAQLSAMTAAGRRRAPTDREVVILSINDIPRTLDRATDGLVRDLTGIRQRQVRDMAALLGLLSEQNVGKPFASLEPDDLSMPFEADVERAIRDHQMAVAMYGAEQVRLELRRQGAPIDLKHRIDVSKIKFTLDDALANADVLTLDATVANAIVSKTSVRAILEASAKNTAARLNGALKASIIDEATRMRRAGLVGSTLESALLRSLEQVAARNIIAPANGEMNEAFSLGRSGEAHIHRKLIQTVVQSALLDQRTCSPCEAIDSNEFEFGSEEQVRATPPYVQCNGRENCRCVQLFIYSGKV